MKIGLDFDNTIVSYDRLFHAVAIEQKLIPGDLAVSKLAVRDHLRAVDQEDAWTEIQGYVYGKRMSEAQAYPGVGEFLRSARDASVDLYIVSHKTRHPFIGPRYDLHVAARAWVDTQLQDEQGPLIPPANVFFELTKDAKLQRITSLGCDWFLDDLPEILLAPGFPLDTQAILFDFAGIHTNANDMKYVSSWREMQCLLLQRPT